MSYFIYKTKKVFYKMEGKGQPIIIVHGNTVSSKLHLKFSKKLSNKYQIISIDLPGHGKSQRIVKWPIDFWFEQSLVVNSLINYLNLENVILFGYSGGALIVLNTLLEFPERIFKIVIDSFEGEKSVSYYSKNIEYERKKAKKNFNNKLFWFKMHGFDWPKIIDQDTNIIKKHHEEIGNFFHKDINNIKKPVLITGSINDEFIKDIKNIMLEFKKKIVNSMLKIYEIGSHPACLTVGEEYLKDLVNFIDS